MRDTENTTTDERGNTVHPAFGVATVSRREGTPRALFQSDIQHGSTMVISVLTADRKRQLNGDYVHGGRTLVEIEMSLSQFGALVASSGQGSGVPITIRRTESGPVPDLPYEPRTAESRREVRESVTKLLAEVTEAFDALSAVEERKGGVRERGEALRDLKYKIANASANASFAVESLEKAAEKVVNQTKADIEAVILQSQQAIARNGGTAAALPTADFEAIASHEITEG